MENKTVINKAPQKPKPWKVINASYVAKSGDRLIIKPLTPTVISVPATPEPGAEIMVIRIGTAATIQFFLQGQNLNGSPAPVVSYAIAKMDSLIYVDSTTGWVSANGFIA